MHRRTRQFVFSAVILAILLSSAHAQRLFTARPAPPYVPGQVVVGFERQDAASAMRVAAAVGATPGRTIPRINAQVFHLPGDRDAATAAADIAKLPGVRYAEPNYRRRVLLAAPNDPAYSTIDTLIAPFDYDTDGAATYFQWTLHQISALAAWNTYPNTYYTQSTKPTNPLKIAVVDTGIDVGGSDGVPHADFINAGGSSPDALAGGQVDVAHGRNVLAGADPTNFADDYGHGTGVAGIAAASTNNGITHGDGIAGLAYHAQVLPVKCLDNSGAGTETDVALGIVHAVDNGALVINLSLGDYFYSQAEQDAVDYAWASGCLVVAAAGNDGDGLNKPLFPAALDGVMAVAATRWAPDETNDYPASYSNYGYYITVGAPGGDYGFVPLGFWFTWVPMPTETVPAHAYGLPEGNHQYQYHMGTSLAAPHVSALACLYASHHGITRTTPNASLLMWKAICRGCDTVPGQLSTPGWNEYLGWGRINAYHTLLDDNNRGSALGGIRGQVKYKGTVVQNAMVEAMEHGGPIVVASGTSHADGMYRISNITPGAYDVKVTYFGESQTVENVNVESGYDLPRVRFNIGGAPPGPSLAWVGTGGYASDGVDPDGGDPNSTTFTFKVKYTDPAGNEPRRARCLIQRRDCGEGWRPCRSIALTKESGDIGTGAVYSGTATLPNVVLKYRFYFKDGAGANVTGPPSDFQQGPLIDGRPFLCWTGASGFEADGANPDSGPLGTNFRFQVLYSDSAGDDPGTHKLLLRRNGRMFRQKPMSAALAGDLRTGKVYRISVTLTRPGTYEYRFYFVDASGTALGPPNNWTAGPTITGGGSATVTALTALPTAAGAQVTFSLAGAANVTATVVNVAGRPIRTLVADKPLEAGPQTLLWDRRADTGLPVPAGLYLIRVTARSAEGGQSTSLATLALR